MKRFLLVITFALFAGVASAQTGTPTSQLAWDQSAANLATAQAFTYGFYPDSAAVKTALASVTCVGTASPFQCSVAFPSFTPGAHTLTLTASNVAGESPKSPALAFTFVVIPTAPTNPHII